MKRKWKKTHYLVVKKGIINTKKILGSASTAQRANLIAREYQSKHGKESKNISLMQVRVKRMKKVV